MVKKATAKSPQPEPTFPVASAASEPDKSLKKKLVPEGTTLVDYRQYPLLPLRDVVIFPGMIIPLFVGRAKSVAALEVATNSDKQLILVAQKKVDIDEPLAKDLHRMGTLVQILQILKLPDMSIKVLVEGLARYRLDHISTTGAFFLTEADPVDEPEETGSQIEALVRHVTGQFETYVKLNRKIPQETLLSILNIEHPGRLADSIAAHLSIKLDERQQLLSTVEYSKRLILLSQFLQSEIEILELENKIKGEVRKQMEQSQREYYLNEQMKAIQRELGRDGEANEETAKYKKRILEAKMSPEAEAKAKEELQRLDAMPPLSPEATVVRNYLDWLCDLPWSITTPDRLDINEAEKILHEDHYGLEKPKERILEFLAVRQLKKDLKGPILCFVGPPGVGKTSLGRSIARALGRKFIRLSLGGVRDEAEIRGHRRTYIGSMPGRIIQSLKKAGSRNPVFLLDEIDKMSVDFRGDPSAALLEVLDPEQNNTFSDHYLEVEFDLSSVMFIATANVPHPVPPALRDRMELIEIPSYTEHDKIQIAEQFLIPKQIKENGIGEFEISYTRPALFTIMRDYTREAGVRNLEREIGSVCRKLAKKATQKGLRKGTKINGNMINDLLGIPRFRRSELDHANGIGIATGLAYTETGGEVLSTEVSIVEGSGQLLLTGKLGEVMQESAKAALTYARSRARTLHLERDFYKRFDVHVHVPEGAIPKDGPSAGITIASALISALTGKPLRGNLAMTGEITLRGRVLPVGGIKEKILAAHRENIHHIILPAENRKHLAELPGDVLKKLKVTFVENMDSVLATALVN
ncbi:MAG TPA: endopeptidase La [bacterium]|nr:endopeptidase La [bacterium]